MALVQRLGVRKANNQPVAANGLVTTTAGPDLVHTIPLNRSVMIRKIMASNHTGAPGTIIFGTQTNAGVWVPLFPTLQLLSPFDAEWNEWEVPEVEFVNDTTAAGGTTGNILVQASIINILIRLEVEEIGP